MARKHAHRKRRGGNKKRTTVRSVFTAIQKCPRGTGASVREIYRLVSKNDKGRSRRTLSSVKLAISRAVKMGSIRAPKGWSGFRGMRLGHRRGSRAQMTRYGRNPHRTRSGKYTLRASSRRSSIRGRSRRQQKSSARRRSSSRRLLSKTSGRGRGMSHRFARGARSLSRGARSRSRGARSISRGARSRRRARKNRGRGRSQRRTKSRRACISNSNNSCPANSSDNYNSEETPENGASTSFWPTNTCIVS